MTGWRVSRTLAEPLGTCHRLQSLNRAADADSENGRWMAHAPAWQVVQARPCSVPRMRGSLGNARSVADLPGSGVGSGRPDDAALGEWSQCCLHRKRNCWSPVSCAVRPERRRILFSLLGRGRALGIRCGHPPRHGRVETRAVCASARWGQAQPGSPLQAQPRYSFPPRLKRSDQSVSRRAPSSSHRLPRRTMLIDTPSDRAEKVHWPSPAASNGR